MARIILLMTAVLLLGMAGANAASIHTEMTLDAVRSLGVMKPLWRDFAQGSESGDPDYLQSAVPWMKPLKPRLIRTDTTVEFCKIGLDESGNITADFSGLDQWIEIARSMGADPLLCLSYTPAAFRPEGGSEISPPADLKQWEAMVYHIVKHVNVDKGYGVTYWEAWNEPNHAGFWSGTLDEYHDLYAATARGAIRADPNVKIGGGAFSGSDPSWFKGLLDYVKKNNVRIDFVSWHDYNVSPEYHKQTARRVKGYLSDRGLDAELLITEWNWHAGLVAANDNEIGAAYAARCLHHMINSPLDYATFFEIKDGWKAHARYWGRWGLVTYDGFLKAVYYTFKAFSQLGTDRVSLLGGTANVNGLASREGDRICAIIYNSGVEKRAVVDLNLKGLPAGKLAWKMYLIDSEHSNPMNQGSNSELEQVQDLVTKSKSGVLQTSLEMKPHSVMLIVIEPAAKDSRASRALPSYRDRPTRFRAQAVRVSAPPAIDGDLSDWNAREIEYGWNKPSAACRFQWDDDALYIGVRMREDEHLQTMPDSEIWAHDSLQVGFDTLGDARLIEPYGEDDYEYGFALTPRGYVVWRWECPGWKDAGPVKNVRFAGKRNEADKTTTYEIAIPWSELDPFLPIPGAILKTGLAVNDVGTDMERDIVEWGGGIGSYKEPALFRPLYLAR